VEKRERELRAALEGRIEVREMGRKWVGFLPAS
jgi:hypothetical protein